MTDVKQETTGNLLTVSGLSVEYRTIDGTVRAVNGLDLVVNAGESLGLVGETGAGKTTTALAILKLLPPRVGFVKSGEALFSGKNLLALPEREMRSIRGNRISMIFQNPMTSLNPVFTIGQQIEGVLKQHQGLGKEAAIKRSMEMLELVGIPGNRVSEYPHQFSGGMRQRVGIAIALACNPELLIADEPTTALDVTIQAQVLALMSDLRKRLSTGLLLITHDLGVVAENCDTVAVMYAGSIVEKAPVQQFYQAPKHPYTLGLFGSLPDMKSVGKRLKPVVGTPADPMDLPPGCTFAPRCEHRCQACMGTRPPVVQVSPGHEVYCHIVKPSARGEAV